MLKKLLTAAAALALLATPVLAQSPEKSKIVIGVGGKPLLYYRSEEHTSELQSH